MPVKRRLSKARATFGFDDWDHYLATGYDLFGDLRRAGVTVGYEPPPEDLAHAAWAALAGRVIAEHGPDVWAAKEFGAPSGRA
jgi:hypothetical protein